MEFEDDAFVLTARAHGEAGAQLLLRVGGADGCADARRDGTITGSGSRLDGPVVTAMGA